MQGRFEDGEAHSCSTSKIVLKLYHKTVHDLNTS